MLDLLAAVDTHRNMCDAPVPTELQANAVSSTLAALRGLVQDDMTKGSVADSNYYTAYAATSDDKNDSSVETYTEHRHRQKKDHTKKDNNKKKKGLSSRGRRCNTNANDEVNERPSYKKN